MIPQSGHCFLVVCRECMLICRSRRTVLTDLSAICEELGSDMYTWRHSLFVSSVQCLIVGEGLVMHRRYRRLQGVKIMSQCSNSWMI